MDLEAIIRTVVEGLEAAQPTLDWIAAATTFTQIDDALAKGLRWVAQLGRQALNSPRLLDFIQSLIERRMTAADMPKDLHDELAAAGIDEPLAAAEDLAALCRVKMAA